MARFYGDLKEQARTPGTRRGNAKTGLVAHIRGWNVGVKVDCAIDENGKDVIRVTRTGGSNQPARQGQDIVFREDE